MIVVVDGNDGTGKTLLAAKLVQEGYTVQDRGVPTKMTDGQATEGNEGEIYLILDAPVEVSRERLAQAGRDLNERYHTVEDLTYYRQGFLNAAETLADAYLIDASGDPDSVLALAVAAIRTAEDKILATTDWGSED